MNTITVSEFDSNGRALDSNGQLIVINNNGTTMVLKKETEVDTDKLKVVVESINE
jgi:hypothetical protein